MRIWRVGIAQNAVFFHSFVASLPGKVGGSAAEDVAKFAPRLRAKAIWKSKSLKTERFGALLEAEDVAKVAPRLRARTIWKSKPLKHQGFKVLSRGRCRDFDTAFS